MRGDHPNLLSHSQTRPGGYCFRGRDETLSLSPPLSPSSFVLFSPWAASSPPCSSPLEASPSPSASRLLDRFRLSSLGILPRHPAACTAWRQDNHPNGKGVGEGGGRGGGEERGRRDGEIKTRGEAGGGRERGARRRWGGGGGRVILIAVGVPQKDGMPI